MSPRVELNIGGVGATHTSWAYAFSVPDGLVGPVDGRVIIRWVETTGEVHNDFGSFTVQ